MTKFNSKIYSKSRNWLYSIQWNIHSIRKQGYRTGLALLLSFWADIHPIHTIIAPWCYIRQWDNSRWDKRVGIYILGKYALFLAGVSRMSKMLFPSIQFIITGLQFQMSINTQSTNTQIQFVMKCQKYQTYALFLNSWCFQDVRNCVPKCLIQKYRNKDTQIQLYTIHIPQPCARRAHGH